MELISNEIVIVVSTGGGFGPDVEPFLQDGNPKKTMAITTKKIFSNSIIFFKQFILSKVRNIYVTIHCKQKP
jgi:hypothetical protein